MKTMDELNSQAKSLLEAFRQLENPTQKDRMAIPPQPMPSQTPEERRHNTQEVALGYTEAQAVLEANRCLQCPGQPCRESCPVKLPIRDFVHAIAQGDFSGAIQLIKEQSLLPAVCGRVCPQERQCQSSCTVGKIFKTPLKAVAIGRLERFVADRERASGAVELPKVAAATGKRVAVVGSGPSSLTVAADTRRAGHDVTVFEAFHKFGGVMQYGIPEFRLPKAIVNAEVNNLRAMGVRLEPNFLVGRTKTLSELVKDYDAVFLGIGAGLPKFMDLPGENLSGVYTANEFLTRSNLMKAYDRGHAATPLPFVRRVAVCGGGNVAMDAARTALRVGAEEVYLVYRRGRQEMPARAEEIEHAEEEGVKFHLLCNPKQILGDDQGQVRAKFFDDGDAKFLDFCKRFKVDFIFDPFEERKTLDEWRELAGTLSTIAGRFAVHGIRVGYHNHQHEIRLQFDGTRPIDILFDAGLAFELDVGHVKLAADDPVAWLVRLQGRVPSIHAKPGGGNAIGGEGDANDWKAIFETAAASGTKWAVVECETRRDTYQDVEDSMDYLKSMA